MRGLSLHLLWYRRELKKPLLIAGQSLGERRGFFIELRGKDGPLATAECTPLPGLHPESPEAAADRWRELRETWLQKPLAWEGWRVGAPFFALLGRAPFAEASLQSSVEMLLFSLALRHGASDLLERPPLSAGFEHSALLQLSVGSEAELRQASEKIRERGIRVVKVKIGRAPFAAEREILLKLREELGPSILWRLDANQGLSTEELDLWVRFLKREAWPIDYFEEPQPEADKVLGQHWPLALDESLVAREPDPALFAARVLVLKPNRLGLSRSLRWLELGAETGGRIVLSNAYESRLSLRFYAWLYSRMLPHAEALGFGTEAAFSDSGPLAAAELALGARGGPWPLDPWLAAREAAPIVAEEDLGPVFQG